MSSSESDFFPKDLLAKARHFESHAELYWAQQDALAAIDVLEKNFKIILGLDFFENVDSGLKVQGYTDFSGRLKNDRVPESCRLAREFVREKQASTKHLFTITWSD